MHPGKAALRQSAERHESGSIESEESDLFEGAPNMEQGVITMRK